MEINANKIKNWRKRRGWTQLQLAEICDLNLRTIQRIESSGSASTESISALASAFEVDRDELFAVPRVSKEQLRPLRLSHFYGIIIGATLLGMVFGALSMYVMSKLLKL